MKVSTLMQRYTLLLMTLLFVPQLCFGGERSPLLPKGTSEIGMATGYGWSFDTLEHIDTIPVMIHWGYVFSEVQGSSLLRGNWEALLEGNFHYLFKGRHQYGIGIAGLVRYNFLSGSRWVPFAEAGIGMWHSNVDMGSFPNDYNFSPQAGVGIQYFLQKSMSIKAEYRVQHFSNASLKESNPGLNFQNFLFGVSYYY